MNFLRLFKKKTALEINDLGDVDGSKLEGQSLQRTVTVSPIEEQYSVFDIGEDYISMFTSIAEVFWPIDFIAKRISESHFDIKRLRDDSIVVCDRTGAGRILGKPNPITTWRELVYQYMVYKLATGNTYMRAAMADSINEDATVYRWCSNFWVLPADRVQIVPPNSCNVPLYGIATIDEIIKGYRLNLGDYSRCLIPARQIMHDKDGIPMRGGLSPYLTASSRLRSVRKNISNLVAVYEARNVIYRKRGALGYLVSEKSDEAGTVALEPEEKDEIKKELQKNYGVGNGQSPYGVLNGPMSFLRTNLSIGELQPFEETLEDAIKIAAIYGIPSVLVPRKDQSTFSNQEAAEKSVYTGTIIPMAKRFCNDITRFIGLDRDGYYLDCDFSDVACLQVGLKDAVEVKKLTNEVCLEQFNCGLITINDWRAQIHEPSLVGEIYDKVKFEMTPEELEKVERIIKQNTKNLESRRKRWKQQ